MEGFATSGKGRVWRLAVSLLVSWAMVFTSVPAAPARAHADDVGGLADVVVLADSGEQAATESEGIAGQPERSSVEPEGQPAQLASGQEPEGRPVEEPAFGQEPLAEAQPDDQPTEGQQVAEGQRAEDQQAQTIDDQPEGQPAEELTAEDQQDQTIDGQPEEQSAPEGEPERQPAEELTAEGRQAQTIDDQPEGQPASEGQSAAEDQQDQTADGQSGSEPAPEGRQAQSDDQPEGQPAPEGEPEEQPAPEGEPEAQPEGQPASEEQPAAEGQQVQPVEAEPEGQPAEESPAEGQSDDQPTPEGEPAPEAQQTQPAVEGEPEEQPAKESTAEDPAPEVQQVQPVSDDHSKAQPTAEAKPTADLALSAALGSADEPGETPEDPQDALLGASYSTVTEAIKAASDPNMNQTNLWADMDASLQGGEYTIRGRVGIDFKKHSFWLSSGYMKTFLEVTGASALLQLKNATIGFDAFTAPAFSIKDGGTIELSNCTLVIGQNCRMESLVKAMGCGSLRLINCTLEFDGALVGSIDGGQGDVNIVLTGSTVAVKTLANMICDSCRWLNLDGRGGILSCTDSIIDGVPASTNLAISGVSLVAHQDPQDPPCGIDNIYGRIDISGSVSSTGPCFGLRPSGLLSIMGGQFDTSSEYGCIISRNGGNAGIVVSGDYVPFTNYSGGPAVQVDMKIVPGYRVTPIYEDLSFPDDFSIVVVKDVALDAASFAGTNYPTLAEAVAAANACGGGVVTLLRGVLYRYPHDESPVQVQSSVTIDFNGHSITAPGTVFSVAYGASLTLVNARVELSEEVGWPALVSSVAGHLSLESTAGSGIVCAGSFVGEVLEGGSVTIEGGTVSCGGPIVKSAAPNTNIAIFGGTLSSQATALDGISGLVEVSGGTLTACGEYGCARFESLDGGGLHVKGVCQFTNTMSGAAALAKDCVRVGYGYAPDPANAIEDGHSNVSIVVYAEATLNGQAFPSYEDAVEYANEHGGGTIALLRDVVRGAGDLAPEVSSNVVLDFGGYSFVGARGMVSSVLEGGSLTLKNAHFGGGADGQTPLIGSVWGELVLESGNVRDYSWAGCIVGEVCGSGWVRILDGHWEAYGPFVAASAHGTRVSVSGAHLYSATIAFDNICGLVEFSGKAFVNGFNSVVRIVERVEGAGSLRISGDAQIHSVWQSAVVVECPTQGVDAVISGGILTSRDASCVSCQVAPGGRRVVLAGGRFERGGGGPALLDADVEIADGYATDPAAPEGARVPDASSVSVVVSSATAAASFGRTSYRTLAEAVAAAQASGGGRVTLLRDLAYPYLYAEGPIAVTGNVTVDFAGYSITSPGALLRVAPSGMLVFENAQAKTTAEGAPPLVSTVEGALVVRSAAGDGISCAGALVGSVAGKGSVAIEGGTVKAGGPIVERAAYGTSVSLAGGTLESGTVAFDNICGSLAVSGGKVTASGSCARIVECAEGAGSLRVSGDLSLTSLDGPCVLVECPTKGADAAISAGVLTACGKEPCVRCVVPEGAARVVLSGGTYLNARGLPALVAGDVQLAVGRATSPLDAKGGIIPSSPYVSVVETPACALFGGQTYNSLSWAVRAANEAGVGTVYLLRPCFYPTSAYEVADGAAVPIEVAGDVTIDFYGRSILTPGNLFRVVEGASLTLVGAQVSYAQISIEGVGQVAAGDIVPEVAGSLVVASTAGEGVFCPVSFVGEVLKGGSVVIEQGVVRAAGPLVRAAKAGSAVSVRGGALTSASGPAIRSEGSVAVSGGEVASDGCAIRVEGEGSALEVSGGSVQAQGEPGPIGRGCAVYASAGASVAVSGGEVVSKNSSAIWTSGASSVQITDGIFRGGSTTAVLDAEGVSVTGGTFEGTNGIEVAVGAGGGTIGGPTLKATSTGDFVLRVAGGTANITDGTFVQNAVYGAGYCLEVTGGTAVLSGGAFTHMGGGPAASNNGHVTFAEGRAPTRALAIEDGESTLNIGDAVAVVNDHPCVSLAEMLGAAERLGDDTAVRLLADFSFGPGGYGVSGGDESLLPIVISRNVTLDFGGHAVTSSKSLFAIEEGGSLELVGARVATDDPACALVGSVAGRLALTSTRGEGVSCAGAFVADVTGSGSVVLAGGEVAAGGPVVASSQAGTSVAVSGGSYQSGAVALDNICGTATVSGGTLTACSTDGCIRTSGTRAILSGGLFVNADEGSPALRAAYVGVAKGCETDPLDPMGKVVPSNSTVAVIKAAASFGGRHYPSLAAAVEAANEAGGGTITLLGDVDDPYGGAAERPEGPVEVACDLVLDFNSHAVAVPRDLLSVAEGGTLTLVSAKALASAEASDQLGSLIPQVAGTLVVKSTVGEGVCCAGAFVGDVACGASVSFNGGTIHAQGPVVASAAAGSKIVVSKGTLTSDATAIDGACGAVTISGGTIDSVGPCVRLASSETASGSVEISRGSLLSHGASAVLVEDGISLVVSGGSVASEAGDALVVCPQTCDVRVTAGTFKAPMGTAASLACGNAVITNGTFEGAQGILLGCATSDAVVGGRYLKVSATAGPALGVTSGTVSVPGGVFFTSAGAGAPCLWAADASVCGMVLSGGTFDNGGVSGVAIQASEAITIAPGYEANPRDYAGADHVEVWEAVPEANGGIAFFVEGELYAFEDELGLAAGLPEPPASLDGRAFLCWADSDGNPVYDLVGFPGGELHAVFADPEPEPAAPSAGLVRLAARWAWVGAAVSVGACLLGGSYQTA